MKRKKFITAGEVHEHSRRVIKISEEIQKQHPELTVAECDRLASQAAREKDEGIMDNRSVEIETDPRGRVIAMTERPTPGADSEIIRIGKPAANFIRSGAALTGLSVRAYTNRILHRIDDPQLNIHGNFAEVDDATGRRIDGAKPYRSEGTAGNTTKRKVNK